VAREARAIWLVTAALAIAATAAFALGSDDWGRSLREPTADAAYYYAYLPSLVLDGDLDLTDQYRVTKNWYRFGDAPTGRPGNVFGVGPAVFQLPAFLAGHALAKVSGARGDGFSTWETALVLWTGIPCALGAMLLAYRLARRRAGGPAAAYLGALAAAVAGPLLYYAIRQPGYAHPYAALFATLLIERWDASYGETPRSLRTWLVLGAAAGAAMLARPQLAVWAALLLPAAAIDDLRRRGREPLGRLALRQLAAAAVALIVFAPQLGVWKALYGAWYAVPQGDGFLRWDAPAWSEALFSSRNGLFPWAPLYAPMAIGLLVLARRGVRLPLALLLGLFGQALVNGAAWDWWAGGSFGGRRFDSAYAAFAVGAAALIDAGLRARARGRLAQIAVGLGFTAAILVALAGVELAARTSVVSARIGGGQAASEVWRARIGGVRGRLAAWLSAASNAPARAAFAWRHGLDLGAYDRLVGVHVLGETFPGLNSYPDRLRDRAELRTGWISGLVPLPDGRGRTAAPVVRIRFGINRRGPIALRIPVEGEGAIAASWNGATARRDGSGVLELEAAPTRGVNTVELEAPIGTVVAPLELAARGP
jgi:dolichyl-phosphate-mannose-protein mannosyltransferase